MKHGNIFLVLPLVAFLAAAPPSPAGEFSKMPVVDPATDVVEADPFTICDIFDYATLYENENNPFIQKFALSGRLQADAAFFYGGDEDYESLLWRRARFGFKSTVFHDFTLHAEGGFNLNELDFDDLDDAYSRLTDSYIAWGPSDAFNLKVGKHSAAFTMDGATSSKKLIRMERSLLSNNLWFPEEYHTGIAANGEIEQWTYNFGAFSSKQSKEFSDLEAGHFFLASVGYNFADAAGLDNAYVRADYVYQKEDVRNTGTRDLEHVVSLNGVFEKGRTGIRTDIAGGKGYLGQSDIFAVALMPYYDVTEKLQLVTSWNFVTSEDDNGVRLDRYENRTTEGRANQVHEFYAGFNYYLCGHKLKWQTGLEYTTAKDDANDGGAYNGWGVSSGIRISW